MTPDVVQRAAALAAIALAAAVGALALTGTDDERAAAPAGPVPVTVGETGWYTALAGSRGVPADAERTTCNTILTNRSLGVTHAVLPCGTKIYVAYGGVELFTEVIDNDLRRSGRQFELTEALAQRLGVEGTQQIRWRFAVRG